MRSNSFCQCYPPRFGHVSLIQSTRCREIDQHVHTTRRAAPYMSPLEGGRTQPISSTPFTARRGDLHSFHTMDRGDPHDSNSSTRAPTHTSVGESDTAAPGVPSTAGKSRRASGFSLKKAGTGLESIFFKTVPVSLLSPRSVANHIRRLCRHDQTTICERNMASAVHVSDADKETLRLLCKKMLLMVCRRRVLCRGEIFTTLISMLKARPMGRKRRRQKI